MFDRAVRVAFVAIGSSFLALAVFLAARLAPAAADSDGPVGGAAIAVVIAAGFGVFFLISGLKGTVE